MEPLRFIDGDSHVLEPESIWENYLEKKYRNLVSGHVRWVTAPPGKGVNDVDVSSARDKTLAFELELEVMGTLPLGARDTDAATRSFQDRDLDELDVAYGKWADQDFPASAYREVMDNYGVDHMISTPLPDSGPPALPKWTARRPWPFAAPTIAGWATSASKSGRGACGAASIDLRDPALAAEEVRRCVQEYDFKAVHLNPAPVPNLRLFDPECDVLWAACAELGVPIGLHPSANHPFDQGLLDYLPGLRNCRTTVSFVVGSMLACTAFIMGGVLERHPELKLVFLESGCGWASFWLDRLEAGIQGGTRRLRIQGLNSNPVEYFQNQCFVAADQDDPGIAPLIDAIGDHVIVGATDFGHPEGRKYYKAKQDMMELPNVSMKSKRKIMWDNALRAYPISAN